MSTTLSSLNIWPIVHFTRHTGGHTIAVQDLGQMYYCAIEVDESGFRLYNAANNEITGDTPSERFRTECQNPPSIRTMGKMEAPLSNQSIEKSLAFCEHHS